MVLRFYVFLRPLLVDIFFQLNYMPIVRIGNVTMEESLEVYLEGAMHVVRDAATGLLSNDIVTQVKVPLSATDPSQFYYQVEFKQLGSDIFSQLVGLVTEGHLAGKSWNGNIYPGMFVVAGGQVFLQSGASSTRNITGRNSSQDYLAIQAMLKLYTGLSFMHTDRNGDEQDVMYPMHMHDLFKHLSGKASRLTRAHKANPKAKAMDRNYVVFLRCHSTFQTTAAMSVVLYHVRCYHSTCTVTEKQDFTLALLGVGGEANWHASLKHHWLFQGCFDYVSNRNASYENSGDGCCRLIRDWGTHSRKYLTVNLQL